MIEPIVTRGWLEENLQASTVCDARKYLDGRDAESSYLEGHLPGAIFVDLDSVLASEPGPIVGRHPLPDPDTFATGLGALGIGNDDTVIAYDDLGGAFAARLVWMLRVLGQPAALLDGGLAAWTGTIERGPVAVNPVPRQPLPWPPGAVADADDVAQQLAAGGVVIDSRASARYRGEVEPLDPQAGHVPGAINLPFADNLDDRTQFLSVDRLRGRFEGAGADGNSIVYCGSGVTACHNVLAIEAAGLGRPRLYVGSWSGWSSDPERPVAPGGNER